MSVNQDCAEMMVRYAAESLFNKRIKFDYKKPIDDTQIDITPSWARSNDKEKQVWTSGKSEKTFKNDIAKLDTAKAYFLRTGINAGAGHYQLLYFNIKEKCWTVYSTPVNNYLLNKPDGNLTQRGKDALLAKYAKWGLEAGQNAFLLVEANLENTIRTANFIFDIRTKGETYAIEHVFTRDLTFEPQLLRHTPIVDGPAFFSSVPQDHINRTAKVKPKASLTTVQYQSISELIDKLSKEINTYWPYLNKDRKLIKVNALKYLEKETQQGKSIDNVINHIEQNYPQALLGCISQRTLKLLQSLQKDSPLPAEIKTL